ncbi:HalD/BesD family halogenase [Paeniglutamicibacter cryotolerans]|uniref:Fe2OG dioxygenase domain-containing protein n=1 Tax=Paeniglutamicibacter cryotolerans TaxID=670079 RepID=A0A839QE56_9MICC|nr:2OG-Fe(II) oxygenase [Paeniglutamicibacter cryotolerans]MBB2994528.1 hypothetical protein [Paeniglutamicibacter cryotolerans]
MTQHTLPPAAASYADVVDLDRYPIHDLDSERGEAFVAECRKELAEKGACNLPGFITPDAVAEMVRLANELKDKAWTSSRPHNVYFTELDKTVPAEHPLAHEVRSVKHGIANDFIPAEAPLSRLYSSDDLTRFIAAVLEKPVLFRSADPLDALQVTHMGEGDELGWHFDRSEFSITVMYQPSEEGGEFYYHPALRSDDDPNYDGITAVLQGDETGQMLLPGAPGTLAFFHGHNALHHVTPVVGATSRINTVLTYGEHPDMKLNDITSELFYGRTSA